MSDLDNLEAWLSVKPDQKLFLIAARDRADFRVAFDSIRRFCSFPIRGSMFERPISLVIREIQGKFFPISVNGDLFAWEAGIMGMCEASDRELAWIAGEFVCFHSGKKVLLRETTVCSE
jgi:hypothetical protein